MKNNKAYFGIAFGILFVVYSALVLIFAEKSTPVFWSAYIFTVVAFAVQVPAFYLSYRKKTSPRDAFFGMPLTIIGLVYLVAQVIMSVTFMFLLSVHLKGNRQAKPDLLKPGINRYNSFIKRLKK